MGFFRKPGRPFEHGGSFEKLCGRAFNQCDVDGSGRIDIKELHIGLLILYDKINRVLPIHYPVPSKYEISRLMTEFDRDNSNELTFEEFYQLARFQLGMNKGRWHRSIWFRIVRKWTLKAVVWPAAGKGAKKGLGAIGIPAGRLPTAVAAFVVEAAISSLASLR